MAIVEDPEGHDTVALDTVMPSFAGHHILEIGAGSGRLTRHYAAAAASVIAIDPDADAIADLRTEMPHVDARAIPPTRRSRRTPPSTVAAMKAMGHTNAPDVPSACAARAPTSA